VRAVVIVVVAPCRNQLAGMAQPDEEVLVQAFVPEPAVEALHEAVLHGLARRDVVPLDMALLLPLQDGVRGQLGAVSTLLVAIDISKHRHEVLIGVPGKKRRRRLTIMNTLEDFQRLSAALASYGLPVRIGFEATGNYHIAHWRTISAGLGST
jgi:hypothetical protein